jgi:hypothetical protein
MTEDCSDHHNCFRDDHDIDKQIEELQMKKKLMEKERELEELKKQLAPKKTPEQELSELREKNRLLEIEIKKNSSSEPASCSTETPMKMIQRGKGRDAAPQQAQTQQLPPQDPVQQFLNNKGISEGMRTEDSEVIPRRVAAAEVLKWTNIIMLLGTINILLAFMLYTFNMIGLKIVSDISIVIILIIDGWYMMKSSKHKNYLVSKYQIFQPKTMFSIIPKRKQQDDRNQGF